MKYLAALFLVLLASGCAASVEHPDNTNTTKPYTFHVINHDGKQVDCIVVNSASCDWDHPY